MDGLIYRTNQSCFERYHPYGLLFLDIIISYHIIWICYGAPHP